MSSRKALLRGVRVVEVGGGMAIRYGGWALAGLGAEVEVAARPAEPPSESVWEGFRAINAAHIQFLDSGKRMLDTVTSTSEEPWDLALIDGDDAAAMRWFRRHLAELDIASVLVSRHHRVGEQWSDLDVSAMSGVSWVIGDQEREPLSLPRGLVDKCAGVNAAVIGLILLTGSWGEEKRTAKVDAASVLSWYVSMNSFVTRYGSPWHREGRRAAGSAGPYPYGIFECKDGHVTLIGRSIKDWQSMLRAFGSPSWAQDSRYQDPIAMGRDYPDEVDELLLAELARFTRDEVLELAREFGFPAAPLNEMGDALTSDHFEARGAFTTVSLGDQDLNVPAAPYRVKLAERSSGEHAFNRPRRPGGEGKPLEGLRVTDFSWVWSGPMVTAVLADLGAEVIKIEHGEKLDNSRLRGRPLRDGKRVEGPTVELAPYFYNLNRGKKSLLLDLGSTEGVAVARRLISSSDIVVENMRAGAMAALGLGYEELCERNRRLIYLSMSGFGQTGPLAGLRAYAPLMSSVAGLESLVGYPGEPPTGMMSFGLGDPNAAVHGLLALMAALSFRDREGRGVMIDLSQTEAMLPLLAEQLIECQLEGAAKVRGNTDPTRVPSGIYPTRDADTWVSISIADDEAWRRFKVTVLTSNNGRGQRGSDTSWIHRPDLQSLAGRVALADDVDQGIRAWSSLFHRDELIAFLGQNGVTVSPVVDHLGIEGQLRSSGSELWHAISQPVFGPTLVNRIPWHFTGGAPLPSGPAPLLGQHTFEILTDVLNLGQDEIDDLLARRIVA